MHPLPEDGLHIASSLVHGGLLIISVFHLGYASTRRSGQVLEGSISPFAPLFYDRQKHIVLSLRLAFALFLAVVPLSELVYQLTQQLWPSVHVVLFYTEQVLTILAWIATLLSTFFVARNCKWRDFHPVDHLCVVLSWLFVYTIEALRVSEYVTADVPSLTEKYTSTLVLSLGTLYGLTIISFLVIDLLRRNGKCLGSRNQSEVMHGDLVAPQL